VQLYESSDKLRRDRLEIDAELTDSDVRVQMALMHATKWAQEVAEGCPSALHGINVDFADAIAILIARPFAESMHDHDVLAVEVRIADPLIGIDCGVSLGVGLNVCA